MSDGIAPTPPVFWEREAIKRSLARIHQVRWRKRHAEHPVPPASADATECARCGGGGRIVPGRRICVNCATAERRLNEHWCVMRPALRLKGQFEMETRDTRGRFQSARRASFQFGDRDSETEQCHSNSESAAYAQ